MLRNPRICNAGLEDEPEDTMPAQPERQMRYDDDGLDSEDDFIDDDIGDGVQGQRPRRARSKIRTDGVHSQAVQVSLPITAFRQLAAVLIQSGMVITDRQLGA